MITLSETVKRAGLNGEPWVDGAMAEYSRRARGASCPSCSARGILVDTPEGHIVYGDFVVGQVDRDLLSLRGGAMIFGASCSVCSG